MKAKRLRVVLADDHVALRAGVREALEAAGWEVCADVGSADPAIGAASKHCPDVCLVDLRVPGDGLRAVAEISGTVPGTRVVVLTVSADPGVLLAALRAATC